MLTYNFLVKQKERREESNISVGYQKHKDKQLVLKDVISFKLAEPIKTFAILAFSTPFTKPSEELENVATWYIVGDRL